ncbi:MAG: beta strand repeat-containing protein, partial [Cyclobacteriaceae bacterium]
GTWGTDAGNASIGGEVASGESGNRLQGDLDEIRIASSALAANWISTEYNSQNQPILTFGTPSAGDFYAVAAEEDLFHTTVSNGDWDDNFEWDSNEVPDGQFENVVIQNHIDIDANSADYTVCNCLLSNDGSTLTAIDIESTRVLTVKGDLDANTAGNGGSDTRLDLLDDAQVDVEGNMTWDHLNTSGGHLLQLRLRDDAVLNLTGDLNFTHTDGDDLLIDQDDNSDFNISGDLFFTQDGGDRLRSFIDDASTCNLTGNFIVDQNGGNDILVRMNNNSGTSAQFTVGGDLDITHDGGDDIEFLVDDANTLLDVTGDVTATMNGAANTSRLFFDLDGGNFNANDVSVTRTADYGEIDFDLDGGSVSINSFTAASSGTLLDGGDVIIDIDGASVFTCDNDIDITMTGGENLRIGVNRSNGSTAQLECSGNLSIDRSSGGDVELFVDDNNSLFHVGQNLSFITSGGGTFDVDMDNQATLDVDGNFTITHSDGQNGEFDFQNTGTGPSIIVGGNFLLTNSASDGDDYLFDINRGTFQIDQDFTINLNGNTDEDVELEIDGMGIMNVDGDMLATLTGGNSILVALGANVGGSTSQLNISGDATFVQNTATAGQVVGLDINRSTSYTVGGDLTLTNDVANSDLMFMDLANSSQATITGDINLNAQSDGDLQISLSNTSELQIAGNFIRQASPNSYGSLVTTNNPVVEYNGTAAQLFAQDAGDGSDSFTYENVVINNTSGTNPQVTMEGLATINGSITFMDGVIAATTTNMLVVANNATATGASDVSHVDGPVRKIGNDAFTFPVGDDDNYQAVTISTPGNNSDQFEAQYFEVNPDPSFDTSSKDPSINNVSLVEYWQLDRTAGSSNVTVTLTWDGNSGGVGSLADLVVARWDGAVWRDEGNGGTTGNTTTGTVVSAAAVS